MTCGIYAIRHIESGKFYVGSGKDIEGQRWPIHIHSLTKGDHHTILLQRAWNKYGPEAFEWLILERCDGSQLLIVEQRYLDLYFPTGVLYNTNPIAGKPPSPLGKEKPESFKEWAREEGYKHLPNHQGKVCPLGCQCGKHSGTLKGRKLSSSSIEKRTQTRRENYEGNYLPKKTDSD